MSVPLWILLGSALCLGVLILTAILIILALRRGSQTISRNLKDNVSEEQGTPDKPASDDNRWARGDMKANLEPAAKAEIMVPCPACGGENHMGASACSFCGRKL